MDYQTPIGQGTGDLGETLGDRGQGEVGVDLPLGATQVGGDDHLGTGVEQGAQGGQSGLNAAVVSNVLVGVQRHVEVGADQDSLALEVAQGLNGLHEASHRLWVMVWDLTDGARARIAWRGRRLLESHALGLVSGELGADQGGQADQGVGVAPLVVCGRGLDPHGRLGRWC